jgi:uncharacterized membrane protein HdeD (DUF308 family)
MKRAFLGLGIAGCFGGVIMVIVAFRSREFNDVLAISGILTALASLLILFITKIVIGQRGM